MEIKMDKKEDIGLINKKIYKKIYFGKSDKKLNNDRMSPYKIETII